MGSAAQLTTTRIELEARILVAALKQSIDQGDLSGADQAYHCLAELLRQRSAMLNECAAGPESSSAKQTSPGAPIEAEQDEACPAELPEQADQKALAPALPLAACQPDAIADPGAQTSFAAQPDALPEKSLSPAAQTPADTSKSQDCPHFYQILQLDLLATYKDIHVHFLRLVKQQIADKHSSEKSQQRDFRHHLRSLCIAHDILKDPTTRRLYDLNVLGVHRASKPADARSFKSLENAGVRIGELLQCAEILEASELAIAVDMHRAMPEMMFGEFMVNQGFVSQPELDDTLLGQKLIEQAKITVAQFQLAMQQARQRKTNLKPVLIEHQFVQEEDLL